jgi:hypothetical protein
LIPQYVARAKALKIVYFSLFSGGVPRSFAAGDASSPTAEISVQIDDLPLVFNGIKIPGSRTFSSVHAKSSYVHCVVPGGGLSLNSARWIASRPNFFLAAKPLAQLFRLLFLERLTVAFNAGPLNFFGDLASLAKPAAFAVHLVAMRRISWVVYAKRPFGSLAQVLAYLGPIYPSRCNSQQPARSPRQGSRRPYLKDHEAQARRVHSQLPSSYAARWLPSHPATSVSWPNGHRAAKLALCRKLLDRERAAPNDGEP